MPGVIERRRRYDHVAGNQFLGLDERPVVHADAIPGVPVAPAPPAWTDIFGDEVHSTAGGLVNETRERCALCRGRRLASLRRRGSLAEHHVAAHADLCRRRTHADVPGLCYGADVDLHVAQHVSLARSPLDCVLQRARTNDAEAGRQFVVAFEWTVDQGAHACRKPEPHALRAGSEAFRAEEHTRRRQLTQQRSHTRNQRRARDRARLPMRVGAVHDDEPHVTSRQRPRAGHAARPLAR